MDIISNVAVIQTTYSSNRYFGISKYPAHTIDPCKYRYVNFVPLCTFRRLTSKLCDKLRGSSLLARMVKILKRWTLAEDFDRLYGKSLGEKIRAFWRKGWQEIPENMAAFPLVIVGAIASAVAVVRIKDMRARGYQPKYREEYTVYRPNDPRVAYINNHSALD